MKQIDKGEYGYVKYKKTRQGIVTLIGFAIVAAIYLTGYLVTGTNNNIATVFAILTVLPVAKFMVSWLMYVRFNSPDRQEFDKLKAMGEKLIILSDCVMACKEKTIYVKYAIVTDTCVYCYTDNEKFDIRYFEENVAEFIKSCGDTVSVKLIKDYDLFLKRAQSLNNVEFKEKKTERIKNDFLILVI